MIMDKGYNYGQILHVCNAFSHMYVLVSVQCFYTVEPPNKGRGKVFVLLREVVHFILDTRTTKSEVNSIVSF